MARKKSKARSQAQEALAADLGEWFPFSRVRQEVYIGELVESHGYTLEEMARELGSRPHRLFCDIVLSDSDGDCAFEYHGEQHYHQIGGMTGTLAELDLNQHLDREKSWILERVGVPLVQIPYDAYVDSSVVSRMMEEASTELEAAQARLYVCDGCGRRFPLSELAGGMCRRCRDEETARVEAEFERERAAGRAIAEEDLEPDGEPADEWEADDDGFDPEDDSGGDAWLEARKAEQKERAREARREAYRRWKESPEYQRRKEEQRAARRQAYRDAKRRRDEERNGR